MAVSNMPLPKAVSDFAQDKLKEAAAKASESGIKWDAPHPDDVVWDDEKSKAPSWGDAALSAIPSAIGEVGSGVIDAAKFIGSLPSDPLGYKIGRAIKGIPVALAQQVVGMDDWDKDRNAHPWLALAHGDTGPMRQNLADKPLGLAADVAGAAGLTGPGRALLGKGADLAMAGPRKVVRGIADMTPARRAENALLEGSRQSSTADRTIAALEGNKSNVPGVSLSVAQAVQDPSLTALERASRINPNTAPAWATFDSGQNSGMFNALHGIVSPATDEAVTAARGARDTATKYDRQTALALADQGGLEPGPIRASVRPAADEPLPVSKEATGKYGERVIDTDAVPNVSLAQTLAKYGQGGLEADSARGGAGAFAGPIRDATAAELSGDRGVLPSVKTVGGYVHGAIPETGATAGRAYEVRKVLADALNKRVGADPSELGSAIKSADVSSRVIKSAIDSSLDKASGGMWRQYLDAFAANSKDVNSVEALNNIRAELAEKIKGGALDLNGNPKLSRAYLKQVLERHSTNKYGDLIAPAIKAKLDDILTTAQKIEAPQANYKLAVSGGGGTTTAHDFAIGAAKHLANALGPAGRVAMSTAHGVTGLGEAGGATRLAALLQSPGEAATALRTAAAREAKRKVRSTGKVPAILAALAAQQN